MKIINNKLEIKNFKNIPMIDENNQVITIGSALSTILLNTQIGGKMKVYLLAERFFEEDETRLDTADFNLVKQIVEDPNSKMPLQITGFVLKYLDSIKDEVK